MKLFLRVFQSANVGFCHRFRAPLVVRTFSTNRFSRGTDDKQNSDNYESIDDSERRIFGGDNEGSFFKKLGRIEKAYDRSGVSSRISDGNKSESVDHLGLSLNTLSDGMDGRLRDAATSFTMEDEEVNEENYSFRPDMDIQWGMVLDTKDLDLRKPAVPRPRKRIEFETTTEEVLEKADFRNVRFLANFITEAGIIIKRSKTRISAKAQRKVAREIKTARAFGLMPFTTMGTKQFVFGRTMEDRDEDFEYESYSSRSFVDMNGSEDPVRS